LGPGFTSVWHRDPRAEWTFYSTVNPELGCSRYFGGQVTRNVVGPIHIEWTSPTAFVVMSGGVLRWEVNLSESVATRCLNVAARSLPDAWWRSKPVLRAMGRVAGFVLGTGEMRLVGTTPNGQEFAANPQRMWLVASSRAEVKGQDLGPVGPLFRQARLRDFLIPQRGVFAVANAVLHTPQGGWELEYVKEKA
jgi:hypothetical protein